MDSVIVGLIVLTAAFFIGRRALGAVKSARAAKSGCATDCGCGESAGSAGDWSKS